MTSKVSYEWDAMILTPYVADPSSVVVEEGLVAGEGGVPREVEGSSSLETVQTGGE